MPLETAARASRTCCCHVQDEEGLLYTDVQSHCQCLQDFSCAQTVHGALNCGLLASEAAGWRPAQLWLICACQVCNCVPEDCFFLFRLAPFLSESRVLQQHCGAAQAVLRCISCHSFLCLANIPLFSSTLLMHTHRMVCFVVYARPAFECAAVGHSHLSMPWLACFY